MEITSGMGASGVFTEAFRKAVFLIEKKKRERAEQLYSRPDGGVFFFLRQLLITIFQ
jgi:hypothetical protein